MRTTLLYLPHELFDLAGFGFGWMLIAWVVFSLGLLAWLTWRQGFSRDTASYLPVCAVVGLAIWWLLPKLELADASGSLVGLPIRGYGVLVMLGVIIGVSLAVYRGRQMGVDAEVILSFAFWLFLAGIVGARAFYVIHNWSQLVKVGRHNRIDWWATVQGMTNVTEGGLVVYGAFLGALVAGLAFLTYRRLPVLAIGDLIAPSLLVGLAIGRIGCFLNGCCYGQLCQPSSPFYRFAVTFPRDAASELEHDRPPEARQNSPPYAHQRELGLLHGIRLGQDAHGNPIITEVTPPASQARDARSGLPLLPNDQIESINGKSVIDPKNAPREAGREATARFLLQEAGPEISVQTVTGKSVTWSIQQLPDRSRPVHPTQVYSALNAGLIALLLWFAYPFRRRDGEIFALMLTIYPVTRVLLEFIRDDEPGWWGSSLTIAQWVSLGILGLTVGLWIYVLGQPKGSKLRSGTRKAG